VQGAGGGGVILAPGKDDLPGVKVIDPTTKTQA
jgi:hypothetical protein